MATVPNFDLVVLEIHMVKKFPKSCWKWASFGSVIWTHKDRWRKRSFFLLGLGNSYSRSPWLLENWLVESWHNLRIKTPIGDGHAPWVWYGHTQGCPHRSGLKLVIHVTLTRIFWELATWHFCKCRRIERGLGGPVVWAARSLRVYIGRLLGRAMHLYFDSWTDKTLS